MSGKEVSKDVDQIELSLRHQHAATAACGNPNDSELG